MKDHVEVILIPCVSRLAAVSRRSVGSTNELFATLLIFGQSQWISTGLVQLTVRALLFDRGFRLPRYSRRIANYMSRLRG